MGPQLRSTNLQQRDAEAAVEAVRAALRTKRPRAPKTLTRHPQLSAARLPHRPRASAPRTKAPRCPKTYVMHLQQRGAQAAVEAARPLLSHDGTQRVCDAVVVPHARLRRQPRAHQVQRVRLAIARKVEKKNLKPKA